MNTPTVHQEHKFFDSADWALNKEAAAKKGDPAERAKAELEELPAKLEPSAVPSFHRTSHLDAHKKEAPIEDPR